MAFNHIAVGEHVAYLVGEPSPPTWTPDAALSGGESKLQEFLIKRFNEAKRYILRQHPWNFAMSRKNMLTPAGQSTITDITTATPGVFTAAAHGLAVDDRVVITGTTGPTELNDKEFLVNTVPLTTTFTLKTNDSNLTPVTPSVVGSDGTVRKKPAFDWEYLFDVPTDLLKVWRIDDGDTKWEVEGRQILIDVTRFELRYIVDRSLVTTNASYRRPASDFITALGFYLAHEATVHVVKSQGLANNLWTKFNQVMAKGKFHDSTEGVPDAVRVREFEGSRRSFSANRPDRVTKFSG